MVSDPITLTQRSAVRPRHQGRVGIEPPKTNWAQALDTPPYEAYAVTCGITFTFGRLHIDPASGQVLDLIEAWGGLPG